LILFEIVYIRNTELACNGSSSSTLFIAAAADVVWVVVVVIVGGKGIKPATAAAVLSPQHACSNLTVSAQACEEETSQGLLDEK
jgi:hypothetical protein